MDYEKYLLTYIKQYMDKNYDYLFLKSNFTKAADLKKKGAALVVGSSHSLCGIDANMLKNIVNCSMHSQDLYYDFKCAREVVDINPYIYTKCFISMGYYIAAQDLSKAVRAGGSIIEKVYYPLFKDARNLAGYNVYNPREGFELKDGFAEKIENLAIERLLREGNYYNFYKKRKPYIPRALKNIYSCEWKLHTEEEKEMLGSARAEEHNKFINYKETFDENKEVFKDLVHYLTINGIEPIVVVMPYTKQYTTKLEKEQKEMFFDLLNSSMEDVQLVDFNDTICFEDRDFMDTDHLTEYGARKVTGILADMFKLS